MIEKAVILLIKEDRNSKELLYIRPRGESFYQFPVMPRIRNKHASNAIKNALKDMFQIDVSQVDKVGAVGCQLRQQGFIMLQIYNVSRAGELRIKDTVW